MVPIWTMMHCEISCAYEVSDPARKWKEIFNACRRGPMVRVQAWRRRF
jgi:hypothetical protein